MTDYIAAGITIVVVMGIALYAAAHFYVAYKVNTMMFLHDPVGHTAALHLDTGAFELRAVDLKNIALLPDTASQYVLVLVPRVTHTVSGQGHQVATGQHTFFLDKTTGLPTTNATHGHPYAIPQQIEPSEPRSTSCVLWFCHNFPTKSRPMFKPQPLHESGSTQPVPKAEYNSGIFGAQDDAL